MSKSMFLFITVSLLLAGCAGLGNSEFPIGDSYSIGNSSAQEFHLYFSEHGEEMGGSILVPAKVVRANYNDEYIIVEQQYVTANGNTTDNFRYWIEDKKERKLVGKRMMKDEFDALKEELGIDLEFKELDELEEEK